MDSPLRIVARRDLDQRLLQAAVRAGAVTVSERVVRVLAIDRGFRVETDRASYDADYLVGADGAKSLVRKCLQAERTIAQTTPLDLFSISLTSYPAVSMPDRIDLKFFSQLNGYAWLFPRLDHVSAGICATAATPPAALRDALAAYLEETLGVTGQTVVGALIPSFDDTAIRHFPVEGRYYALVGDAAGTVDPLTREGIRFAVRTGELVGQLDAPRRPGAYQQAYRSEVVPELAKAAQLTRTFFSPRFLTWFVRCLRRSPQVAHVFSDLVAGVQPYRTLRRRFLRLSPRIAMDYLRTWRNVS
jgi:flavin-dependent dehydrogenase